MGSLFNWQLHAQPGRQASQWCISTLPLFPRSAWKKIWRWMRASRGKRGNYRAADAAKTALDRAEALGWNLPRLSRVSDLPVGTQQRVEIIKALATNSRLLIFDEPTAVLAEAEVEELFSVLAPITRRGPFHYPDRPQTG